MAKRGAYLASENKLSVMAQATQADRALLNQEHMAAASDLRDRAHRFEAAVGSQAEVAVSQARREARAHVESIRRAAHDAGVRAAVTAAAVRVEALGAVPDQPPARIHVMSREDEAPRCWACRRPRERECSECMRPGCHVHVPEASLLCHPCAKAKRDVAVAMEAAEEARREVARLSAKVEQQKAEDTECASVPEIIRNAQWVGWAPETARLRSPRQV